MSDLVPHALRHSLAHVFAASESFGVIALALLVLLMIEREVLRVAGVGRGGQIVFSVCSVALLVTVALTIIARLGVVVH